MDQRIENVQYGLHWTLWALGKERRPHYRGHPTEVYAASHYLQASASHEFLVISIVDVANVVTWRGGRSQVSGSHATGQSVQGAALTIARNYIANDDCKILVTVRNKRYINEDERLLLSMTSWCAYCTRHCN